MLRIVCPELLLARSGGVFSCFAKRRVASRNSTATGRFIHVESLHPVGIACQAVGHIDDVVLIGFEVGGTTCAMCTGSQCCKASCEQL